MGRSLRCGIEAALPETDGYAVALGDLPGVRAATLLQLVEAFYGAPAPSIVLPVYDGRRGHPVVFHRAFASDLLGLDGDRGARSVLQRHTEALIAVPTADAGVVADVDTPDAYAALGRVDK
jgi:molybdenum cofactor cytidylyltransferase